jgi:hypothetical protein
LGPAGELHDAVTAVDLPGREGLGLGHASSRLRSSGNVRLDDSHDIGRVAYFSGAPLAGGRSRIAGEPHRTIAAMIGIIGGSGLYELFEC